MVSNAPCDFCLRTGNSTVPICAFVADDVDSERSISNHNTKPLPRGLVAELLPEISHHSTQIGSPKIPAVLCIRWNRHTTSPFKAQLAPSIAPEVTHRAVVHDGTTVK